MLCLDRFSLGDFTFRRGQPLVTQLNHRTRFFENRFSLVQTHIEKFHQIVDRSMCQGVDVGDAMANQSFRLLRRNHLGCRQRHRLAGGNHRAHLFVDFALNLFFTANIDVPAHQLGSQAHVLAALANRETKLIFVDNDFHLPVLDIGDAYLVDLCRRQRVRRKHRRLFRPFDDIDFLASQLANDCLHARALHADAGADRIDIALV